MYMAIEESLCRGIDNLRKGMRVILSVKADDLPKHLHKHRRMVMN